MIWLNKNEGDPLKQAVLNITSRIGEDKRLSFRPAIDQVWELIAPAVPDVLTELQAGVYEAKWWTPVPWEEVKLLLDTRGIVIVGQPYEPSALPEGCAVRFTVGSSGKQARGTSARLPENNRASSLSSERKGY